MKPFQGSEKSYARWVNALASVRPASDQALAMAIAATREERRQGTTVGFHEGDLAVVPVKNPSVIVVHDRVLFPLPLY